MSIGCTDVSTHSPQVTCADTDPLAQALQELLEQLQLPQAASRGTVVFYANIGERVLSYGASEETMTDSEHVVTVVDGTTSGL